MPIGEQIVAARALLRWDRDELADASGVPASVIEALEASNKEIGTLSQGRILLEAIEAAGVMVFDEGPVDGGPGVRMLRRPTSAIDTDTTQTVQYSEYLENDAPPGAGG
ncbi:hypothetical protein FZ934_24585 (plasmid) [Rhizobium grahamii]|uniref:XRE family transcriptional regulator n=1 Tax=Rhizobium grahamii TaxID=1120045 RepID=A0A5Q0CDP2_9HYPH|nr:MULTISPECIES: hypothetical protein [Rhizobium]QFY63435.1 hypothetical protein FZ934_24585 [Rhizobium grahamii]QRM51800.1 hypothetical protein F3Y33_21060 [Rhizobium sp. BG6]